MADTLQQILKRYAGSLPSDATPVHGTNATLVTSTTPQAVLAGVAGKKHYLTKLVIHNQTPAELPTITIQDDEGTPNQFFQAPVGTGPVNGGFLEVNFDPPLETAVAGADVDAVASASLGDTKVHAYGFVGTPGS